MYAITQVTRDAPSLRSIAFSEDISDACLFAFDMIPDNIVSFSRLRKILIRDDDFNYSYLGDNYSISLVDCGERVICGNE